MLLLVNETEVLVPELDSAAPVCTNVGVAACAAVVVASAAAEYPPRLPAASAARTR